MSSSIEEQIKAIEEEISKTDYNKATQQHIGRLKAKMARLKEELEKRRSSGGTGKGYGVKKSGNATIALVGFPSVGKSTLLNKLTDANSDVGSYHFTTLDVIPGIMEHDHAKVQVLDLPGLIAGASKGKGRGREVLSVVRSADLIVIILDVFETHVEVLVRELQDSGLRLNQHSPDVVIYRRERGGVTIKSTVELTKIDEEIAKIVVMEYGYINADVVIREDITEDQLIDVLTGNRIYSSALVILNKIDLVDEERARFLLEELSEWDPIPVSAEKDEGLEVLTEAIFEKLDLIRVYMKPQGQEADLDEPMIVRRSSTIGEVCDQIHRGFRPNFRYANVWGKSAKFPGQTVGLEHKVKDGDIISIIIRRNGSA
ncbi:MAG: GTP-binding protein [Methanomassiliicoccales archaeon]|nr:GTP-binding protein [Methanomassiliicoccales archaeon]